MSKDVVGGDDVSNGSCILKLQVLLVLAFVQSDVGIISIVFRFILLGKTE